MLTHTQLRQLRADSESAPNRLGHAMRLAGVTQVQVGEGAGLSQPYVSQILAGNTPKLPLNRAQALAAFFGCAIEDLFPVDQKEVA